MIYITQTQHWMVYRSFTLFLPILYTECSTHTVRKKPNKDAETEALFDDRSMIEFMSTPHLEE